MTEKGQATDGVEDDRQETSHAAENTSSMDGGKKARKGFLKRVMGSLGLRIILLGINFTTAIVLARMLGPEEYGVYIFALTVMAIIGMPGQAGMPLLAVRETAFYQVDRNWSLLRGFLIRQRQFILLWSALAIVTGIAVLQTLPASSDSEALFWALLLLPVYTMVIVTGAAIRGMQRIMVGQIIETMLRPFLFLLAMGALLVLSGQVVPTAATVLAWHLGAATLALAFGLWAQRRVMGDKLRTARPEYDSRRWLTVLMPLTLFGAINIVNAKFDIVMLRVMVDASEVAYYQVAMQLSVGVLFAYQSVLLVAGPQIARLWRQNARAEIQQLLTWSARYSLLAALPVAVIMVVAGSWIIGFLFGEAYAPAYAALAALCVGKVVVSSYGVIVQLMKLTNWEGIMVKLLLFGTVSNVVLNLLLIPPFGAAGAAGAAVIASVAWKTLALREAKKRMGLVSFVVGGTAQKES